MIQGTWRRVAAALVLGILSALGQAPYDFPLVLMAGMTGAVWLYGTCRSPAQAALIGWAFGSGYFMHALQWIVSPFLVDVARHGWMAPFALVLLGTGLALFWAAAFWGARRISHRSWPLILCWPAAELVRAYVFTGFPWAMPAQAMVDVLAGQALADVGPYALNLWLVAVAVALAFGLGERHTVRFGAVLVGLLAQLALILPPDIMPQTGLDAPVVRLVQPNAAQRDKWNPEMIPVFFERQLAFTAAAAPAGAKAPDLVIWSETAIPWALDRAEGALVEITRASGGTPVALGVLRRDDVRFFNSMVVLDGNGAVAQTYDKHHLVPFGEYMPMGDVLASFGFYGLAAQQGHGYSSGLGAQLLDLGPLGKVLPLICYEAVFAHDVNAAAERPAFLIQITNDAWFGKGAGPKQHLAQARMRAIEQGLPLARSANTGISAMIDPYGRVTAALPLNTAGFVDAPLPLSLAPTLYSRTGDLPLAVLLIIAIAAAGATVRLRNTD